MCPPYTLLFILASVCAGKVYHKHPSNKCLYYQEIDCPEGTKWSQDKKRCEDLGAGQTCPIEPRYFGGACDVIHPCAGNLQCVGGKCACAEGHFLDLKDKCLPQSELGEPCKTDDQCAGRYDECVSGECKCKDGYTKGLNTCVPGSLLPDGALYAFASDEELTSPGYPEAYINNLHVGYRIAATSQTSKVTLTFKSISVESPGDYVEVYDGKDDQQTKLAHLTGKENEKSYTSSGPNLFVVFHSDANRVDKGFMATYSSTG